MSDLDKIFKAYDVRGIVPDELDETVAEAVGAAFVRLTGTKQLVTLHDMRPSSGPLADAIGRGATSQGADVIRGGLGSTDMVYYASGSLGVPGLFSFNCLLGDCCARTRAAVVAPCPEEVQFISLYSRSDEVVNWESCLDPAAIQVEVDVSHIGMGYSREVWDAVADELGGRRPRSDVSSAP